jgi:transcriptional regulator with XRE-family HTH domain
MSLYEQIARRLKAEREDRNLSQHELADKLGVAANTVSRWETGTYKPKLDDLDKIATVLNLDITQLIPQNRTNATSSINRLVEIASMLRPEDIEEVERFAEFRRVQTLNASSPVRRSTLS